MSIILVMVTFFIEVMGNHPTKEMGFVGLYELQFGLYSL